MALGMLFVLLVVAVTIRHNLVRPRILILQSYGPDYAWTRDVDVGIRRVLHDDGNYVLRWHYMDLKRHPWAEAKAAAGLQARHAIDDWRPDVLIAVDDDAQKYAARFYVNRPDIRIVFAGINGSVEPYGYDGAGNVTGILERKSLDALRDTLLLPGISHGKPPRLIEISDASETVKLDHGFITAYDWKPVTYVGASLVSTYPEWQAAILATAGKADIILSTNYRQLSRSASDRTLVPPREVMAWTQAHAPLPVIGVNGFFVEDGGMLAIATSPFEQGEVAAHMAQEIIDHHTAPSSIPVDSTHQYIILMRPERLAAHNIQLPPLYEAFARATNNFFDENGVPAAGKAAR